MSISRYWVGQIPAQPINIEVRDSSGELRGLADYNEYNVILIGSDNEVIDTTGAVLQTGGAWQGKMSFVFPTDRSLFTKPGDYLLQLELVSSTGARDFTTPHDIKVSRLGGVN